MGYICAKNNANYPQNEAGMMVLRKKCHAVTKIRFSNITIPESDFYIKHTKFDWCHFFKFLFYFEGFTSIPTVISQ